MVWNVDGLRIDHILGLFRLWWIPENVSSKEGAYVDYNYHAMIGILMIEAYRANSIIIGEDLGSLEDGIKEYLKSHGILGSLVLQYERNADDSLKSPNEMLELVFGSVTTHDEPPSLAYLSSKIIKDRQAIGLLPKDNASHEVREFIQHRNGLINSLASMGYISDETRGRIVSKDFVDLTGNLGEDLGEDLGEVELEQNLSDLKDIVAALYKALNDSPVIMKAVSLVDLACDTQTQNLPGTSYQYPNWRMPLSDQRGKRVFIDDLFTTDFAMRIAGIMNGEQ
jgi:4-alpha-glucanotransferase